jgi:hypothetical protein
MALIYSDSFDFGFDPPKKGSFKEFSTKQEENMSIKIHKKGAEATTHKEIVDSSTKKTLSETGTTEKVDVPKEVKADKPTSAQLCEVKIESGYTHNLGNFQSARVAVSLMVPCETGELDQVASFVEEWVNTRMEKLVADLKSE